MGQIIENKNSVFVSKMNDVLSIFKLNAVCISYNFNKPFVVFGLIMTANGKVSKLKSCAKEIGLIFKAKSIPSFEEDIGSGLIKLIIQIADSETVFYDKMDKSNQGSGELPFLIGRASNGENYWMDIASNPHMLIAGTTGSGKSSFLHVIIANALERKDVELYISDPKSGLEFGKYSNKAKVAVTYDETLSMIRMLHSMMNSIYEGKIKPNKSVIVIVDEVADLIDEDKKNGGELESLIVSLAQKARAAKIFLILATQRPDVKVLNGRIKANFPARVACRVNSVIDSKIILDDKGAENLLGKGDSLVKTSDGKITRVQLAYKA
jgi:S-DNA-T family DNA segregation ATPase FtsK/SpoIIIE